MSVSSNKRARTRKVDERLPRKGNSNSHGSRPVHLIITMIKWILTSRLSMKKSLCRHHALHHPGGGCKEQGLVLRVEG